MKRAGSNPELQQIATLRGGFSITKGEFIGEAVTAAYSANPGPYGRAARDVLNLK